MQWPAAPRSRCLALHAFRLRSQPRVSRGHHLCASSAPDPGVCVRAPTESPARTFDPGTARSRVAGVAWNPADSIVEAGWKPGKHSSARQCSREHADNADVAGGSVRPYRDGPCLSIAPKLEQDQQSLLHSHKAARHLVDWRGETKAT